MADMTVSRTSYLEKNESLNVTVSSQQSDLCRHRTSPLASISDLLASVATTSPASSLPRPETNPSWLHIEIAGFERWPKQFWKNSSSSSSHHSPTHPSLNLSHLGRKGSSSARQCVSNGMNASATMIRAHVATTLDTNVKGLSIGTVDEGVDGVRRQRSKDVEARNLVGSGGAVAGSIKRDPVLGNRRRQSEKTRVLQKRGGVLEQLLCGGFAGIVSRTAVAPLDLIRTHLISSHGIKGVEKTATGVLTAILKKDGWRGLFRGNGVNCLRVGPNKAIELCVFQTLKRLLASQVLFPFLHPIATPLSGGAAGLAGTLCTYPLELMRTRISVQPEIYKDIGSTFTKIVREEGMGSLYRGLLPSLVGVFPYAATNYFVYDSLRLAYRKAMKAENIPTVPTLLFGAIAASVSSSVTFPIEVARRRLQLGGTQSALTIIRQISANEGPLAIYRGLGTTWLKLIPAAGISFVCYEAARVALKVDDASYAPKNGEGEGEGEEEVSAEDKNT